MSHCGRMNEKDKCKEGLLSSLCMNEHCKLKERRVYYYIVTAAGEKVEIWRDMWKFEEDGNSIESSSFVKLWQTSAKGWRGNTVYPGIPMGGWASGDKKMEQKIFIRKEFFCSDLIKFSINHVEL